MPTPLEVYQQPASFWSFLTTSSDDMFEGQQFDRKEAGRPEVSGVTSSSQVKNLIQHIKETISAYANADSTGGILVLGVASNGTVKGIRHLSQTQLNSIMDIDTYLVRHASQVKFHPCRDEADMDNQIALIYVPQNAHAICETTGRTPEAWIRRGPQNVPLTQDMRDQLRRNRNIVDFENTYCCDFSLDDVDLDLLTAFRSEFVQDTTQPLTDVDVLYAAGAIFRKSDGNLAFNMAGLLFFASNPQRVLAYANIRLLRFDANFAERSSRGLPNFERQFTGSILRQIREAQTYFRESGFFKTYQRRHSGGGFIQEPEYPPSAVDEAIVNAAIHRDYGSGQSIVCEAYHDAFQVMNPGRISQPGSSLPETFALTDKQLESVPRNSKLLSWLKVMRSMQGRLYVQSVGEGTQQIAREMRELHLPVPSFYLSENSTRLLLRNNSAAREAALRGHRESETSEFTNLYAVQLSSGTSIDLQAVGALYQTILNQLSSGLIRDSWYIDRLSFGRIVAHKRNADFDIPRAAAAFMKLFPAYELQFHEYSGQLYLCIEYTLLVLSTQRLTSLLAVFAPTDFIGLTCTFKDGAWRRGRITSASREWARILVFDDNQERQVPASSVIPKCPNHMLETLLKKGRIPFDLARAIKQHSLAAQPAAAHERSEKISAVAEYLAQDIFPISTGALEFVLDRHAVRLWEQGQPNGIGFPVSRLVEPSVVFREQRSTPDVRDGITRFGAFEAQSHVVELVPVCVTRFRPQMEKLIERIRNGAVKYRGSERTFGTSFRYSALISVPNTGDIHQEVQRLLIQNPEWCGDKDLQRLFFVHTPEQGYALDDETSPYYSLKRLLLENGIPCQMVDTPTLIDPEWKDLNLALNMTAKCGVTPWVLPDAIPAADFFIGLSYTESRAGRRIMGFANVFNRFGKWEFYSGNTSYFDYEKRKESFSNLVRETLGRLQLSPTPNIIFHYSAKFAKSDIQAILHAAREIRPQGIFTFVWINSHHIVRVFDSRPQTDGSLQRGSYMQTTQNQIYLSTTGQNPYRRALGTPMPLEISASTYGPDSQIPYQADMKSIAKQVLSLTKLNWASTDAFCGEPITTKYARSIAYLTAAFLRQSDSFRLHPVLERTPWFL